MQRFGRNASAVRRQINPKALGPPAQWAGAFLQSRAKRAVSIPLPAVQHVSNSTAEAAIFSQYRVENFCTFLRLRRILEQPRPKRASEVGGVDIAGRRVPPVLNFSGVAPPPGLECTQFATSNSRRSAARMKSEARGDSISRGKKEFDLYHEAHQGRYPDANRTCRSPPRRLPEIAKPALKFESAMSDRQQKR